MIENLVFQSGYPGLFIISVLSATLLPLGSEIFVVTMTLSGYNPLLLFLTATIGNTLGAYTNYYVGKYGTDFVFSKYISVNSEKRLRLEQKFQKWGSPILFFAWTPIIGDPLTVVAGVVNIKLSLFSFWVILGKAFRYALIIYTAGMV